MEFQGGNALINTFGSKIISSMLLTICKTFISQINSNIFALKDLKYKRDDRIAITASWELIELNFLQSEFEIDKVRTRELRAIANDSTLVGN